MQAYSKPILRPPTIQSGMFVEPFQDHGKDLAQPGYNDHVVVTPVC